jgi:hypothetical protein
VAFAQTTLNETFSQLQQSVAVLAGGGFGVVWQEGSYPNGDVRMQWLDREARPLFPPGGRLVAGTPADERDVVIAAHPSAGAYVAFKTDRNIAVQYFDGAGQPQWPGEGVLVASLSPSAYLTDPHVVANPPGGAFVCFRFAEVGPTIDVRCQHVDSAGARQWSDSGSSVGNGGDREVRVLPRGLSDGAGGLLVFWRNQRDLSLPAPGPMLMEGQRFAGDGQKLWGAMPKVVRTTGLDPANGYGYRLFQVVSDGLGGAVLAFDDQAGSAFDVMAQRVSPAGDLLWGAGAVVTNAGGLHSHEQTIAAADGGAFVVTDDYVNSSHNQLRLFRLGSDGNHVWPAAGVPLSDPGATGLDYAVFGSFDGGVLRLGWTHQIFPATFEMDIQFATYASDGSPTGGTWLTQVNDLQFLDGLVYSPHFGGILGVWDDRRKGTWSDRDVMGAFLADPDLIFKDAFEGLP